MGNGMYKNYNAIAESFTATGKTDGNPSFYNFP
jgi:hypothetical protein